MQHYERMDVDEISDLIGIKEETIKIWARTGKIPAYKFGSMWGFNKGEILEWIQTRKIQKK